MGSFANSLHVKCNKASNVIASIESVLRASGYAPTDEQPSGGGMWDEPSPVRGLYVSQAHNGWVAVLDSEFYNSESLANALSQHLKTYVIQFMVHDSDSWYYQLLHDGEQLDEFCSSGEYEANDTLAERAAGLSGSSSESRNQAYRQRLRELAQRPIEDTMPDEIRAIRQRMIQREDVSESESTQLREWVLAYTQQVNAELKKLKSEGPPPLGETPVPTTALHLHLERLRPILPEDTPESRVLEILGKQEVFAEQTLWEFIGLIGIQQLFANLSYPYLEECSEEELLAEDIRMIAHLKFKTDAISS